MADILIDNQTTPSTPASSKSVIYVDSTTKKLATIDDGGTVRGALLSTNHATSQQTGFATDTYLTGSSIIIPSSGMQVGQLYCWEIGVQKTAAGTTALAVQLRLGTNQSTADTSRLTLTQTVAQAATAAGNIILVRGFIRTVSASGVIVGALGMTGHTAWGSGIQAVSSTFDNTSVAGQYLGLSLNGGTSAAYTIDYVKGWLVA